MALYLADSFQSPDFSLKQTLYNYVTCIRRARWFCGSTILVPRAYDPSRLQQESRALGATIWNNKGNSRILPIRFHPVCIYGACLNWLLPELLIPPAGQKDCRLWRPECCSTLCTPTAHDSCIISTHKWACACTQRKNFPQANSEINVRFLLKHYPL